MVPKIPTFRCESLIRQNPLKSELAQFANVGLLISVGEGEPGPHFSYSGCRSRRTKNRV